MNFLIRIIRQNPQALAKLNTKLEELGLPIYHYGGTNFNTDYSLYPTPRFVLSWRSPFIVLNEIYLVYKNETKLTYINSTDELRVNESS